MRNTKSPICVVAGLVELVDSLMMPAACSTSAAGIAMLVEIGPRTAVTPSSTKRLAQATDPSTVVALSQMESSNELASGIWARAASIPCRVEVPMTAKRPESSRLTPMRVAWAMAAPSIRTATRTTIFFMFLLGFRNSCTRVVLVAHASSVARYRQGERSGGCGGRRCGPGRGYPGHPADAEAPSNGEAYTRICQTCHFCHHIRQIDSWTWVGHDAPVDRTSPSGEHPGSDAPPKPPPTEEPCP
jgi:hypothetical protein